MRSTHLALAIVLGALALSSSASAQRVELAGRVTASRTVLSQRRVGETRYIAFSDLFYRDHSAYLEVLDLAAPADGVPCCGRSVPRCARAGTGW